MIKNGDPEKPLEMKSVYLRNLGKFYPFKVKAEKQKQKKDEVIKSAE